MKVEAITLYPVKATRGVPVESAEVELSGLRHDRRWAVVDLEGRRLNATHHGSLLAVTAAPGDDGSIVLGAAGLDPLPVPVPSGGPRIPVNVSRLPEMIDAGEAAAAWFTSYLGLPTRLVWQDDPAARTIAPGHGGTQDEPLNLADAGPLLLTSAASLTQLNEWIGDEEMAMLRFRPNVVVDGDVPFAEDDWSRIRLGDVDYRFAERCDRCVVTTIDPDSLHHGKEPIRTLARHRKWDGKTWFGIRIVPLGTGTLAVGDAVHVTTG